jgi:hypothetical protein
MDLPLAVNPSGCVRCEPCLRTLIKRHKANLIISSSPKKERELNEKRSFYAEIIVPRGSRSSIGQNYITNQKQFSPEYIQCSFCFERKQNG